MGRHLQGDSTRLTQIFSNLLNNAVKYTPPGGEIEIDVRGDTGQAVVTITDSGIGLPAASLPTVFDMFGQIAGRKNNPADGLGIGLSLVHSLVELHGGSVSAQSPVKGGGCVFEVRLPLSAGELPQSQPESSADVLKTTTLRRILIADDNVDAADSLNILLQALGHDTAVAYDGVEALEVAEAYRPDIVFLDIGMPGMNGYEVATSLRKTPGLAQTVLIALTGWGAQEDRVRSQAAGFDHHLTKPATPSHLMRILDIVHDAGERSQGPD